MPNRLAYEASLYLRQHADNPVDWHPWGNDAFDLARERDVPIFLSIGYSSCHWCHVMAHESFESEQVAALMNERFVNIKVDREELPAVDNRYMQATMALTGHGGWPMSVWLDHDRNPWYAGTYFPPRPGHGSASFVQVILAVSDAWANDRSSVLAATHRIGEALESLDAPAQLQPQVDGPQAVERIVDALAAAYDPVRGGFGAAPKFPPPIALEFLNRCLASSRLAAVDPDPRIAMMLDVTFEQMARGGLRDHLSGGFARYCVDNQWAVPHFEKMLYDNAQLLDAYLSHYLISNNQLSLTVVHETADFLIREMTTAEGAFASAVDADSEDESGKLIEGAYYTWTPDDLTACLAADDVEWACELLGVTPQGNMDDHRSVLSMRTDPSDLQRWHHIRQQLLKMRSDRTPPVRDNKVVSAWNGLAIRALARAGLVLGRTDWIDAAVGAADVIVASHLGPDGVLARASYSGTAVAGASGLLEDHALMALAFTQLAQADGDPAWLELAGLLISTIQRDFVRNEQLVDLSVTAAIAQVVPRTVAGTTDSVTPSEWVTAVAAAVELAALTGDTTLRSWADQMAGAAWTSAMAHGRFAASAGSLILAMLDGPREVAIDAEPHGDIFGIAVRTTAPGAVISWNAQLPMMQGRTLHAEQVHVCRNFSCELPLGDPQEIAQALGVT